MADTPFKSPYRENITDERVLNISAKNDSGQRANWTVRYAGNKVRLSIWTGVPNDTDNGKMSLILEVNQWYALMSLLLDTVENAKEPQSARIMTIKTLGPKGWKEGPIPRGDIYVGRSGEGVIYISLIQPNRPKIAFTFESDAFYGFRNKDNSPLEKSAISDIVARSYAKMGMEVVAALAAVEYVAKDDRPQSPRARINNSSNNNQQSYQQQNPAPQTQQAAPTENTTDNNFFDDDIAF